MTVQDVVQLIAAIGTVFLGVVALFAVFYPRIHSYLVRPKLYAIFEPIDEGKGGANFKIFNLGKTVAHGVIATLYLVDTDTGATFGTYTLPWKVYSLGFQDLEEQMMEARYGPISIYPKQEVFTRGLEILGVGTKRVLGLLTLPYRPQERDFCPPVFWELEEPLDNIEAPLRLNRFYAVYLDLYSEELTVPMLRLWKLKWDGKRIVMSIDDLSLEFKKQKVLQEKISEYRRHALLTQEKRMLKTLKKSDKQQ